MRKGVPRPARFVAGGCLAAWLSGCAGVPRSAGPPLVSPSRFRQTATLPAGPIRTVVIDAGHGGHDPGTSHYGLKEKVLALDVAKRLRTALQAEGFSIVMTRETDQFIPLSGRPAVANRLDADLFVSIHINANRDRHVAGAEIYYPRVSVVAASAPWPPSVSSAEIGESSTTIKQVLWDLVLRRTRTQSRRLASAICRSMRDELGTVCRLTKPARFVVLREAWMPAVLVEVGYVTNRIEAKQLGSEAYRAAAAEAIARGILAYARELAVEPI